MWFGFLKNVNWYIWSPPKIVYFERSDTGASIFFKSPNNLASKYFYHYYENDLYCTNYFQSVGAYI